MDGSPSLSQERSGWLPFSDPVEELMVSPSLTQEWSGWFLLSDPGEEWMVSPLCLRRGVDGSPH